MGPFGIALARRAVAGVTARLARTLHECNSFNAAWLPFGGFLPGGLRAALMVALAAGSGGPAVSLACATTVAAAVTALLGAAAVRPSAGAVGRMAGACGRGFRPPAGAPVGGGDRHPDHLLDVAQEGCFLVIAE